MKITLGPLNKLEAGDQVIWMTHDMAIAVAVIISCWTETYTRYTVDSQPVMDIVLEHEGARELQALLQGGQ